MDSSNLCFKCAEDSLKRESGAKVHHANIQASKVSLLPITDQNLVVFANVSFLIVLFLKGEPLNLVVLFLI
jgi:hypothetical protein